MKKYKANIFQASNLKFQPLTRLDRVLSVFSFKEFVMGGQEVEHKHIKVKLPNVIEGDQEKALGLGWEVE